MKKISGKHPVVVADGWSLNQQTHLVTGHRICNYVVTVQEYPISARSGLIHIGITIVHRPDCTDMEHS